MSIILPAAMQPTSRRIARPAWQPLFWFSAMLLLLVLQLLSGTQVIFSLLVLLFCFQTYWAIRACGGIFSLTGFTIFYMAMQNLIISQVAKVIYWRPADINLQRPLETLLVLNLAMLGICLAALAMRRLKILKRPPLFDAQLNLERLFWLSLVCTFFAAFQEIYSGTQSVNADTGAANTGGLHGLLHAITYLSPLAVAAGTSYLILSSGGRKSFGLLNGIAMAIPCLFGIIGAGRQNMTTTLVVYYVTCFLFRFKFRPVHFAVLLAGAYVCQFILFPYALYARSFTRTAKIGENLNRAAKLLGDVIADPVKYQQLAAVRKGAQVYKKFLYYGKANPTLDRYSLIIVTDGIVDATLRSGTIGMTTIQPGFEMSVPRIFAPEKISGYRNTLAHREPGMVGKDDYKTGISTGFASDAFSSYGWAGAFGIPFLITLALFSAFRLIMRDRLWSNIYAISLIFYLPWRFSETNLAQLIVITLQGATVMVCILFLLNTIANSLSNLSRRLRRASQRDTMSAHVGRALHHPSRVRAVLARSYSPALSQSFAADGSHEGNMTE